MLLFVFFFSSRRRHTRFDCDWSSDVCSSDLTPNHKVFAALRSDLEDVRCIAAAELTTDHYLVIPREQAGNGIRIDAAGTLDTGATLLVNVRRVEGTLYEGRSEEHTAELPSQSKLLS